MIFLYTQGIIEPHSVMEVPLVITPQGIEELETTCYFSIFGSPDPSMVSIWSLTAETLLLVEQILFYICFNLNWFW